MTGILNRNSRQPACSKGRRNQKGAVAIEFVLSFMIVMTTLFWTLELCMLVYTRTVLSDAANEGVRYAIVHSADTTGTVAKVKTYAAYSLHNISKINVSVAYPDGALPPGRVAITVTYTYVPYLKLWSTPPTLTAFAESRLVY